MFCRECGREFKEESINFCDACGTQKGKGRNYCENCGAPVDSDALVCENCGIPIRDEITQSDNQNSFSEQFNDGNVQLDMNKENMDNNIQENGLDQSNNIVLDMNKENTDNNMQESDFVQSNNVQLDMNKENNNYYQGEQSYDQNYGDAGMNGAQSYDSNMNYNNGYGQEYNTENQYNNAYNQDFNGGQNYNDYNNGQNFNGNINNNYYPRKSRMAAGLFGIFLGGLGIHNFYLGFNSKALTQLLVCLIGGIFTCGLASLGMSIWGLVEGIMILTGSINTDSNGVPLAD